MEVELLLELASNGDAGEASSYYNRFGAWYLRHDA